MLINKSFYTLAILALSLIAVHVQAEVIFTSVPTGLPANCSPVWGDYDGDGDLDIALVQPIGTPRTAGIYRNDGNGIFTDIQAPIAIYGPGSWIDYDCDGDLDLVMSGTNTSEATRIYRNDNGTFVDSGISIPCSGWMSWGDYDNDGDPDLLSQSLLFRNDKTRFTQVASIPGAGGAWGDYDNDGDLDLAVTGSGIYSSIYRNDNGIFTPVITNLVGNGPRWVDFDNDGDLDLAFGGVSGELRLRLYQNDGGVFKDTGSYAYVAAPGNCAWGDFDNDGITDAVVNGYTGGSPSYICNLYRNSLAAGFTKVNVQLPGCSGILSWGDFDADGDLDLLAGGADKILKSSNVTPNTPPTAPTGLSTSVTAGRVTFSWNAASDTRTPAAGLTYNLRVGTTPGAGDVCCPMSNPVTGTRFLPMMGNAQKMRSWTLNLPRGTYYWSVQSVDTAFAGSQWAVEQTVVVDTQRISGQVTPSRPGVSNVTISTSDGITSARTELDGSYELWVPTGWTGTTITSGSNYTFDPPSRSYEDISMDQLDQNFTRIGGLIDSGIDLSKASWGKMAWADFDNDGDLDLTISGDNVVIYRNDAGKFTNISISWTRSDYFDWGDYDNDGDLDLALGSSNSSGVVVRRNDGGTFKSLDASGLGMSGVPTWADFNGDGKLDLAICGTTTAYPNKTAAKIFRNENGTFIDSGMVVPYFGGASAWGDYDRDGDMDLAVSSEYSSYTTKIYRNNNGSFTNVSAVFPLSAFTISWVDYDNDGDLDLFACGNKPNQAYTTKLYRNDAGIFNEVINTGLPDFLGVVAWGDYDNDGDQDLAISGIINQSHGERITRVYRCDGDIFTDIGAEISVITGGSVAWGDYNNDGRLDLAINGSTMSTPPTYYKVNKIYDNNCGQFNTPPTAPNQLKSVTSANNITFSWTAGNDSQTPQSGLTYNLRVGTAPGRDDLFSGASDVSTGFRRYPRAGNAGSRLSWRLQGLPDGACYWSVQAVDAAYAGSAWATEQSSITDMAIGAAKAKPDGASAGYTSVVVTKAFGDSFYVEEPNRTSAIRVDMPKHGLEPGTIIDVAGTLGTSDEGERCITAQVINQNGTGIVRPLTLLGRDLGGSAAGAQDSVWSWRLVPDPNQEHHSIRTWLPAVGQNTIGLLVNIYGRVTQIDPAGKYFYLDDGSGVEDGTLTGDAINVGVRIAFDGTSLSERQLLRLTGVCSCFKGDDGKLRRLIKVQKSEDIQKLENSD